jgi:hypothetical protein
MARAHRAYIDFTEEDAFVFELALGDGLQLGYEFFDGFTSVGFNNPNHHDFTAGVAADGFAEHGVRFAHARRVAQKQPEPPLFFSRRLCLLQPLLATFPNFKRNSSFSHPSGFPLNYNTADEKALA